jgi:hypothetical protein
MSSSPPSSPIPRPSTEQEMRQPSVAKDLATAATEETGLVEDNGPLRVIEKCRDGAHNGYRSSESQVGRALYVVDSVQGQKD